MEEDFDDASEPALESFDLKHWCGMTPLTEVCRSMLDFLNQDSPPSLYSLPSSCVQIIPSGFIYKEAVYPADKIFIGSFRHKLFLVVKDPSLYHLTTNFSRVTFQSETSLDWSKVRNLIKDVTEFSLEGMKPSSCEILSDGKLSLNVQDLSLPNLDTKPTFKGRNFVELSSSLEENNKIFKFLSGPPLDKDCHIIKNSAQPDLTSPIDPRSFPEDVARRNIGYSSCIASAAVKLIGDHLDFIQESEFIDSTNPLLPVLNGMRGLAKLASDSLSVVTADSLNSALNYRKNLRKSATKNIGESLIQDK